MTPDDLKIWARCSEPGNRTTYHRGFLIVERVTAEPWHKNEAGRLYDLADMAMALEYSGVLKLVQRRLGKEHFQYIAERTHGDWQGSMLHDVLTARPWINGDDGTFDPASKEKKPKRVNGKISEPLPSGNRRGSKTETRVIDGKECKVTVLPARRAAGSGKTAMW